MILLARTSSMDESTILTGFRVRLKPTAEQVALINKYFGIHRYFYNLAIAEAIRRRNLYHRGEIPYIGATKAQLWKLVDDTRNMPGNEWMADYDLSTERLSAGLVADAVEQRINLNQSINLRFKKKKDWYQVFFTRSERVHLFANTVQIPGIGEIPIYHHKYPHEIRAHEKLILDKKRFRWVAVIFDQGKYWVTGGIEVSKQERVKRKQHDPDLSSVGIDIGVKPSNWIVDSRNGDNSVVTKPDDKRLDVKIRSLIKQYSNKLKVNDDKYLSENQAHSANKRKPTKNEMKLITKIQKAISHRSNRYDAKMHEYISELYSSDPGVVVIEDFRTSRMVRHGMRLNAVGKFNVQLQYSNAAKFRRFLTNKSKKTGIPLIAASTTYPSTQLCSVCGYRRCGDEKLTLSDRVFICPNCGSEIDRDLNSSYNLKYLGWSFLGDQNFPETHNTYRDDYSVIVK